MNIQHTACKCSLIGIALLLFVAAPAFSQQPVSPPLDRRSADRERLNEQSRREWQLRNFGNPGAPPDRRRLEALMAQTEEDFNKILALHNEIARAISSNKRLDYQFVSEATSEIHKRAGRLQSNLALGLPSEEAKNVKAPDEFNDAQMKDGLIKLCKQIRSFVTNPIIETPNTVDAEKLAMAKRDLETLIQLSDQIRKDATRLSKTQKE
jgi:hypothetical protein